MEEEFVHKLEQNQTTSRVSVQRLVKSATQVSACLGDIFSRSHFLCQMSILAIYTYKVYMTRGVHEGSPH